MTDKEYEVMERLAALLEKRIVETDDACEHEAGICYCGERMVLSDAHALVANERDRRRAAVLRGATA